MTTVSCQARAGPEGTGAEGAWGACARGAIEDAHSAAAKTAGSRITRTLSDENRMAMAL
jgi:hypothetical protein